MDDKRFWPDNAVIVSDMNIIFIVGAGRSGTTWLHMMLGAYPSIATAQESQFFHNYLRKLYERWNRELNYPDTDKLRRHGITALIDEEKFIGLLRQFAVGVFENVLLAKPGAGYFLEKSPNNSFNIDLIVKCFPEAKFIHVIRDGRDVVTSMLAARKSWGRQWAPQFAADAAAEWREAVNECQRLNDRPECYTEVRYEELLTNGRNELRRVFEFLGLAPDDSTIDQIYDRFSFEKLKQNQYDRDVFLNPGMASASGTAERPEPEGFFRKGVAGDWKSGLSESQLREVFWAAGDTLSELGYAESKPVNSAVPLSVRRRQLQAKIKNLVRAFGAKVLS